MTGIVAVLCTFTLYVLTHWAICRWRHWRSHSRAINVLWLCFLPMYGLMFYLWSSCLSSLAVDLQRPSGIVNLFNGLLLNFLLLLGYTYFFFLVERGLSLRVMIEIGQSSRGKLTIAEIQQIYTYDYILEKRLGQMFKMGYAVEEGGVIRNTQKGSKLVAANRLVRKVLRLEQMMP
jgi:hypothetical protein